MTTDPDKIKRIISKSYHKINGIIFSLSISAAHVTELIIVKGSGKDKRFINFVAFGEIGRKLMTDFKKGSRIKIRFMLKSNEHGGRYYLNAQIKEFYEWPKREGNVKQDQYAAQRIKNKDNALFPNEDF